MRQHYYKKNIEKFYKNQPSTIYIIEISTTQGDFSKRIIVK